MLVIDRDVRAESTRLGWWDVGTCVLCVNAQSMVYCLTVWMCQLGVSFYLSSSDPLTKVETAMQLHLTGPQLPAAEAPDER